MAWSKAVRIGVAVALLVSAAAAVAQAPKSPPPPPPSPPATVTPQLTPGESPQLVTDLPAPVDPKVQALQEQVRALQERLQLLEQQLPQIEAATQRLQKLEEATQKLPEATSVVSAGDFPGSLRIPGTESALKIGGRVQVTLVDSFAAIGSADRFITSSIPIAGTATPAQGPRLAMTSDPSRFNIDVRSPSKAGAVRSFIEADFAGSGGTLRLRHAFAQWDRLLVGQTWSTFSDPAAEPDSIDFEGLNAISLFRPVQVRYNWPLADQLDLAVGLENPKPEVANATAVNQFPDLVARLRWDAGRKLVGFGLLRKVGHVQLAAVLRQIRVSENGQPAVSTAGYGAGASGRLNTGWIFEGDDLTFSAYAGKGISRYITDLDSFGGQDAFIDPTTGGLDALPIAAGYLGYEVGWNQWLRSTYQLGAVRVYTLDSQPPTAFKKTLRGSVNLIWTPLRGLDFVAELLLGKRWNKDGSWGEASQLQVGTRYFF
jgi:hypothetical protein